MAPLLSWHTAASPTGVRACLSAAGGFQGLRESSQDKWSELWPCTGCSPTPNNPSGWAQAQEGFGDLPGSVLPVCPSLCLLLTRRFHRGLVTTAHEGFPIISRGFTRSGTGLGRAEMLSALAAGPQQLPSTPVPTAVLLIRGVGAVVDAVAVFAGWDAGAIGALEAVALLL